MCAKSTVTLLVLLTLLTSTTSPSHSHLLTSTTSPVHLLTLSQEASMYNAIQELQYLDIVIRSPSDCTHQYHSETPHLVQVSPFFILPTTYPLLYAILSWTFSLHVASYPGLQSGGGGGGGGGKAWYTLFAHAFNFPQNLGK